VDVATSPRRADAPWPSPLHVALLQVAFLDDARASEAWLAVRDRVADPACSDDEATRLLPLVYRRLVRLAPDAELGDLAERYRLTWAHNRRTLERLAPVLASFEAAGIATMALKGVPLALCYYRDLGARPMADVDLLVPTDRADAALALLDADGWRSPAGDGALTRPVQLRADHARSAVRDDGFSIDLHWHLREQFVIPGQEHRSSDHVWAASVPLEVSGVMTRAPAAADLLLHVVVHGLTSHELARARWAADAATLCREPERVDWDRFVEQAQRRRVVLPARAALELLVDVLDVAVPADVLARLGQVPVSSLDRRAFSRALSTEPPRTFRRSIVDLGPRWSWRRAKLGRVRALLDAPGYRRDLWRVAHTWQLPGQALRRAVGRARRQRGSSAAE
jgi:hypothetical protein